jgi:putative Mg2+ transporter-C (MgtC) family protein
VHNEVIPLILESMFKLLIALLLGGVVGVERENKVRPAGLRTHILVSMGSALVQIISINYIARTGLTNLDPMRLGAQVISGIGFLGAGTILKEGANIKGLTTAASIWAVACIGLAAGSGLYIEATLATILIYIALRNFKRIERLISKGKRYSEVIVTTPNVPGTLGRIGTIFGSLGIHITAVNLETGDDDYITILLTITKPYEMANEKIVDELMTIAGIRDVKLFQ